MAYSGFISNPEYTRRGIDEEVTGKWNFKNEITFEKVIRGTAMAAYCADIAEYYKYDFSELIPVGSLVKFGGKEEITKTQPHDRNFFGVVSSNPAFILNEKKQKQKYLPIALTGRVPCRITGKIKKFSKLTISNVHGVAKKKTLLDYILFKPTIGILLEDKPNSIEELKEIFVIAKI